MSQVIFQISISNSKDTEKVIFSNGFTPIIRLMESNNVVHGLIGGAREADKTSIKGREFLKKAYIYELWELTFIYPTNSTKILNYIQDFDTVTLIDEFGNVITPDSFETPKIEEMDGTPHIKLVTLQYKIGLDKLNGCGEDLVAVSSVPLAEDVEYNDEYAADGYVTESDNAGNIQSIEYTFDSPIGNPEGTTVFRWYFSDDQAGLENKIVL